MTSHMEQSPWEASSFSANEEILCISVNLNFITTRTDPTSCLCPKPYLSIPLFKSNPCNPRSSKCLLFLQFPRQNSVRTSCPQYISLHRPLSASIWIRNNTRILWTVQTMEFLNMYFVQPPATYSSFGPNFFPNIMFPKPRPCVLSLTL
jgi:hypothetical protein